MTLQTPASAGNCCECVADGVTILGNGSPSNPFHTAAVVGGNRQSFAYVATGLETATFTLALPAARPTTNYVAFAADGGRVDGTLSFFVCPVASYTVNSIQVKCTQAPAAGDVIIFNIVDKTS